MRVQAPSALDEQRGTSGVLPEESSAPAAWGGGGCPARGPGPCVTTGRPPSFRGPGLATCPEAGRALLGRTHGVTTRGRPRFRPHDAPGHTSKPDIRLVVYTSRVGRADRASVPDVVPVGVEGRCPWLPGKAAREAAPQGMNPTCGRRVMSVGAIRAWAMVSRACRAGPGCEILASNRPREGHSRSKIRRRRRGGGAG